MRWREPRTGNDSKVDGPKGFDDYDLKLGDILRGERATLGKSLLDVERELKIRAVYIAAIENTDPSVFETQGFVAGYVRSYARYLRLDPDAIFKQFCDESGFKTMHGMSEMASSKSDRLSLKSIRISTKDGDELFSKSATAYLPEKSRWYENIEPGAIGSLSIMVALVATLGYGAWSVFQEVQKVNIIPAENKPFVLSELSNIETVVTAEGQMIEATGVSNQQRNDLMARIYRSAALDQPIIVSRDEPISKLDPFKMGVFATTQDPVLTGIEAAIAHLVNPTDQDIIAELPPLPTPKVSQDTPPEIALVVSREAWVEIIASDGSVIYKNLMQPGAEFILPQSENAPKLLAGMSGYVYMAVNGTLYGPLGKGANIVQNLDISTDTILAKYEPAVIENDNDLKKMIAEAKYTTFIVDQLD